MWILNIQGQWQNVEKESMNFFLECFYLHITKGLLERVSHSWLECSVVVGVVVDGGVVVVGGGGGSGDDDDDKRFIGRSVA